MEKIWAVVPAAGMGKRMGMTVKKQFIQLKGKEILTYNGNKDGADKAGAYLRKTNSHQEPYTRHNAFSPRNDEPI